MLPGTEYNARCVTADQAVEIEPVNGSHDHHIGLELFDELINHRDRLAHHNVAALRRYSVTVSQDSERLMQGLAHFTRRVSVPRRFDCPDTAGRLMQQTFGGSAQEFVQPPMLYRAHEDHVTLVRTRKVADAQQR